MGSGADFVLSVILLFAAVALCVTHRDECGLKGVFLNRKELLVASRKG